MFGWLANPLAYVCPRAAGIAVERRWLRIAPRQLVRRLPAAGCVLYLPCAPATAKEIEPGLLAARRELTPLLRVRWLVAASAIGSDGPHEWLECRGGDGRLRARLHLLPDSDYLGWDALLTAGMPMSASVPRLHGDARIEAAQLLDFRCRRWAGLDVLDAAPATRVSALGGEIAQSIARAEGLPLA